MKRFFHLNNEDDVPLMKKDDNHNDVSDSDDDDVSDTYKKNDITLWVLDAVVLVVEHLQVGFDSLQLLCGDVSERPLPEATQTESDRLDSVRLGRIRSDLV